ncbi:MAG: hypothetical protein Tsb0021_03280 [Chlamydiales bacterium]
MWKICEQYVTDVIKGRKQGLTSTCVKSGLWFASLAYAMGARTHHWTYDNAWRRRYFPPVPTVISVGNIVAGGTGKTPLVIKLASALCRDLSVAVLTRGYRSPAENLSAPVTLSQGKGPVYPSSYCGDEPYMIAETLPELSVYVGKDRCKSSKTAARNGADVIILDDGMQYRSLARDLEIVIVDGTNPLGHGYYLPRGLLRETPYNLKRAHLIVINNVHEQEDYHIAQSILSRYTTAPTVGTHPYITAISDLQGNKVYSVQGKKIAFFCGLANPDHFRSLLTSAGAEIIDAYITPDHTLPNPHKLKQFATESAKRGAEYLVCTEKDRVKIQESIDVPIPILWVRIELKLIFGEEIWTENVSKIRDKILKIPRHQGA